MKPGSTIRRIWKILGQERMLLSIPHRLRVSFLKSLMQINLALNNKGEFINSGYASSDSESEEPGSTNDYLQTATSGPKGHVSKSCRQPSQISRSLTSRGLRVQLKRSGEKNKTSTEPRKQPPPKKSEGVKKPSHAGAKKGPSFAKEVPTIVSPANVTAGNTRYDHTRNVFDETRASGDFHLRQGGKLAFEEV